MRNKLYKLSFYSALLVILVGIYSNIYVDKMLYLENINSKLADAAYFFLLNNITISLVPGIFAIGYAFISFSILKNTPKQHIIMVINALILIIVSLFLEIVIIHKTSWFHLNILIKFAQTMCVIGLLNIMLSFTYHFFKEN